MNTIIIEDIAWLIEHTDWKLFKGKKILITGASGSIARYLVFYSPMVKAVVGEDGKITSGPLENMWPYL